jgi:hypothetical protein
MGGGYYGGYGLGTALSAELEVTEDRPMEGIGIGIDGWVFLVLMISLFLYL